MRRPVVVADLRQRSDYHLPPIYPDYGILASANVPIISGGGLYGVLEIDSLEVREFDTLDLSFLVSVAGIVADAVERVRRHSAMASDLEMRATLLREHHHRVRNNFAAILAQLESHARAASTENSRQRFEDLARRVFTLASLYDHLLGDELSSEVELGQYLAELCAKLEAFHGLPERQITLAYEGRTTAALDLDTCTAVGTVVNELVANSVEHAFDAAGGRIEVRFERGGAGELSLGVADNGRGFRPAAAESVGLGVAHRLVQRIGGTMALRPHGGGTAFIISLPPR
jgi:two-component sensor histidine kinase